jgi:ribosomal protein S8
MAIIKVVKSSGKSKGSIKAVADYVGKKAYDTFGINCSQDYKEIPKQFDETKEYFGKNGGRLYKHYIQSFAPNEVKKEDVIEIAKKWAERVFRGYEVFIATHDDKNHLHAHFVVNSVSFENGRKLHESKNDLKEKKKINDEICLEYGIENKFKPKPRGEIITFNNQKYQIIKKGADVTILAEKVLENMKTSKSKEEFINNMKKSGYQVEWSENKKNVVFTISPSILKEKKNKFRLSNLQKTFNISDFTKERLLEIFKENKDKELDEISRKIDFRIEKERTDNKDLKSISEDTNFNKKDLATLSSKEFDFKINEKENSFERYINSKKEELER